MRMSMSVGAALLLLGCVHVTASALPAGSSSCTTEACTIWGKGVGNFSSRGQFNYPGAVAAGNVDSFAEGAEIRSHLLFGIPDADTFKFWGITPHITAARVELSMSSGYGSWASKRLAAEFYDVDQDHTPWLNTGGDLATNLAIFNDLGSGKRYGSALIPFAGAMSPPLVIELSADAVSELNKRLGQPFAIGVSAANAGPNEAFLLSIPSWGCTPTSSYCMNWEQRLVLTLSAVPEPSGMTMMLLGLGGLLGWRKRKAQIKAN